MAAVGNSSPCTGLVKSSPVLERRLYLADRMVEVLDYTAEKWQFSPPLYLPRDKHPNWYTGEIDILADRIKIYYYKGSDDDIGIRGFYVDVTNYTSADVTLFRLYRFDDGKETHILAPGKSLRGCIDSVSGIFKAATGTPKGADDNKEDL